MPKAGDERKHLAVIIAYFKRREGIPSEVAEACKGLLDKYGSPSLAASATGGIVKKPESISVWARFLDLPNETRELFDSGKISRSLVYDLISMAQDQALVSDTARAIADMPCKDAKRVIREVKRTRDADVSVAKRRVVDEIDKEEVYVALVGLPSELCIGLTQDDALQVLENWLRTRKRLQAGEVRSEEELKPFMLKIPRSMYLQLRNISRSPADLIRRVLMIRLRDK